MAAKASEARPISPTSPSPRPGENEARASSLSVAPRETLKQRASLLQQPETLEELPPHVVVDRINQAQKRLDMLCEVNRKLNKALVEKKVLAQKLKGSNNGQADRIRYRAVEAPARAVQIGELQEKLQGEQSHQQTGTLEMSKKVLLLEEKINALTTVNTELQERHRANRALIAEQQIAVKQKSKQARDLNRAIEFMEGTAPLDNRDNVSVMSDASEAIGADATQRRWSAANGEGDASGKFPGKGKGQNLTMDDFRRLPGLNLKKLLGDAGESRSMKGIKGRDPQLSAMSDKSGSSGAER